MTKQKIHTRRRAGSSGIPDASRQSWSDGGYGWDVRVFLTGSRRYSRAMSLRRIISLIALSLLLGSFSSVQAEPIDPASVRVIDGHTIAVQGKPRHIRLTGFNAPGIRNAKCKAEARLGKKAKNRLRELVKKRPLELTIMACACKPGAAGTRHCNGGRACGMLTSRGWDVGEILIGEGLAVPFKCSRTSCPKTPRPWCG